MYDIDHFTFKMIGTVPPSLSVDICWHVDIWLSTRFISEFNVSAVKTLGGKKHRLARLLVLSLSRLVQYKECFTYSFIRCHQLIESSLNTGATHQRKETVVALFTISTTVLSLMIFHNVFWVKNVVFPYIHDWPPSIRQLLV